MKSPEYDEIDALLEGLNDDSIDAILDEQDESEAEIDALLGGIDEEFLAEGEDIYLENKDFINDTPIEELDQEFVQIQANMMNNIEDILEEYSGGCMSGEHFGLDQEYDIIDELEFEMDTMGAEGSCAGCGSHNVHEGSCAGCGSHNISAMTDLLQEATTRADVRSARRAFRRSRRDARKERRSARQDQRQLRQDARQATRRIRKSKRLDQRIARIEKKKEGNALTRAVRGLFTRKPIAKTVAAVMPVLPGQSQAFIATRRKYIRLAKSLERACLRFRNLRIKNRKYKNEFDKNALAVVSAPASVANQPFSVMTSMYVDRFGAFVEILDESMGAIPKRQLRQARRRKRQIMKAAKVCDEKYQKLIAVWKKLNRLGNTQGLQSPRQIIGKSGGWLRDIVRKSRKKVQLTQREKSRIRRSKLISQRRLQKLREERALEQLERQRAIKERQRMLADIEAQRKQDEIDAKFDAAQDLKELQSVSSYIYDDDLQALEAAAMIEKKQARDRQLAALPEIPPVSRRQQLPLIPQRDVPVQMPVLPAPSPRRRGPSLVQREMPLPAPSPRRRRSVVPTTPSLPAPSPRRRGPSLVQREMPLPAPSPRRRGPSLVQREMPLPAPSPRRRRSVVPTTPSLPAPSPRRRGPSLVQREMLQATSPVRKRNLAQATKKKIAKLQDKIKAKEKALKNVMKKHEKSLNAKRKAEQRNLKPAIIQNHYQDVKKYAQVSSNLREEIAGYKVQLQMLKGGLR